MSNLSDFFGGGGGGVTPPLPASTSTAMPVASLDATYLPMAISSPGEYVRLTTTVALHTDEAGVQNWLTVPSDIQASSAFVAFYWDKVEDRLYALTYNVTSDLAQFAWINTLTGTPTLLGIAFISSELDQANDPSQVSMTRAVQGSGNFLLSLAGPSGMGSIEIPPAGGSQQNPISNIIIGGISPDYQAAYKIDDDLYIDNIAAPPSEQTIVTAGSISMACYLTMVSSLGMSVKAEVRNSDASVLGCNTSNGQSKPASIRDWGGDIVIWWHLTQSFSRSGVFLFDKIDFHRWAIDVAIASGARAA